ncbi:MAG: S8 family serine peptidase [Acetobacteraceae bacterium]|nr:S8 family serine peptidase [Acetobacteraceae bacterium]
MRKGARSLVAVATVLLLVLLVSAGAMAGQPATALRGEKVRTTVAMDGDRNRIFDDLDKILARAKPDEGVGVIVMLEKGHGLGEVHAAVGKFEPRFTFPAINGFAATLNKGLINKLARLPFVVQVEYDAPVYALLDTATYWEGVQKARADFGVTGDRNGNETSYTKDDIVVAIIDTGIDPGHQDLDGGKIIGWKDYVNGQTSPYDDHGHGTHCASIAAGEGQANPNYKGVAPGAALVGVKVLNSAGSGTLANVEAGIQWCIDNKATYGIEIISLSLGTTGSSDGTDSTSQMVNKAVDNGLVATVAAGNSGPARYTIGSPGAAEKCITVGAMTDPGHNGFSLASFSSRGPTADGRTKPDICAPGVNIMAAQRGTTTGYVSYSGTSMATPFTAGTAALMLDANPSLTPQQIKDTMANTAIDWGPAGKDVDYGWGRLDAYAAVKAAGGFTGTGPAVPGHDYRSASLTGTGDYDEYTFNITTTSYPIAVTLIMPNWASSSNPNFDLYLYNPSGAQVASSTTTTRQDTINYAPSVTGNYKVKVSSTAGSGSYFFDISAGLGETPPPDNPPTCSIAYPSSGAVVSGTVRIKVSASDDKGLTKVEAAIDSGSYIDITGNFDGNYYFYDWDTTTVPDGGHTIKARATDNASQVTNASPVNVTVSNGGGGYQHTVTKTGRVTSTARDSWQTVQVTTLGYIYITLNWDTSADLDFFVYAPDGTYIDRAYTLNKPETLRIWTDDYTTGTYSIKVNLYSGADSNYTLTIDGYEAKTQTGHVDLITPDKWHTFQCDYTGNSYIVLSWPTYDDLDFYVYDPTGTYRSRAYTIWNPETLWQTIDMVGAWQIKVNLYFGITDDYTLTMYVPEDNLMP